MKKKMKLIIVSLVLTFISCEKNELTQNEANTTANKAGTPPVSVGYTDITSLYINNGLSSSCTKNILVFPSWARYNQVIDYLDQQTEIYCDTFDALQPAGQTDDEYDLACDAANFDEDNKLVQFENNKTFCSLRKKLVLLEESWLNIQGDGVWNINEDPDEHFIEDDTERACLNEGVEVIIGLGTRENPYKIYKFNADGSYYIISNMNTTVLQQINNGTYVAGSSADVVKVIDPKPIPPIGCKYEVKDKGYAYDGNSRIKWKAKSYRETGASQTSQSYMIKGKIIAKTKSYKKKNNGGWKGKRAWITAGIQGNAFDACDTQIAKDNMKSKKRRKVKVKETINPFDGILPQLHYLSFQENTLDRKSVV